MTKCKECMYYKEDVNGQLFPDVCLICADLPRKSNFKEKTNPLANLFNGAPVMVRNYGGGWHERYWKENSNVYSAGTTNWSSENDPVEWVEIRLPTVEEAPRNTWLAAPGDGSKPEGIDDLLTLVWTKNSVIPATTINKGRDRAWNVIERYMILEK